MNIYLVFLLILAIIVFSNLITFAAVRGSKGTKVRWLNTTKDNLSQPFQKEDSQLNELRQRVEELSQDGNQLDE